jgi:NTE family protein
MPGGLRTRIAIGTLALAVGASVCAQDPPARPRIGIVLGGGSAKGIAHVGVLRWLEEHRVPVDLIAGTSMGGLVGGSYATGMTADEIHQVLRGADWDLIFLAEAPYALKGYRRQEDAREFPVKLEAGLRGGSFRMPGGLNPGHHIGLLLSRIALDESEVQDFDQLPIPFRCVATDVEQGEAVVLNNGPLGTALRATMAIPGVFDPVRIDGRLLVDGGILDNVPIDVAREMGADQVIAVNVSGFERKTVGESALGLAGRSIDVMMNDITSRQTARADVVISPDLGTVASADFREVDAIVAKGYQAAAAHARELLPLALSEAEWSRHLAGRKARRAAPMGSPAFVEVVGAPKRGERRIAGQLQHVVGQPLNLPLLETDIDRIIGAGRFAAISYERVHQGTDEGLRLRVREKSYAPPSLRQLVDINNEGEDVAINIGGRLTFLDLTGYDSELRLDLVLGQTTGLSTELYQPLGTRGLFLAPHGRYARAKQTFFANGDLTLVARHEEVRGGLDVGRLFGRHGELRLGYDEAYVKYTQRIGESPVPEVSGREAGPHATLAWDGLDSPTIPRRGIYLRSAFTWFVDTPQTAGDFGQSTSQLVMAAPTFSHDRVVVLLDTDLSVGDVSPPPLERFTLGGPFRLSAFGSGELRGSNALLARALYLRSLARLPNMVGDRLYLAAIVEGGSAYEQLADARGHVSVGAGLMLDTMLGPVFVGYSYGDGNHSRFYFTIGRFVRRGGRDPGR